MNASFQNNEIRFAPLAEALRQEVQTGPMDATKSLRVREGFYNLRGQAGRYIVRIRVRAGVLTAEQLEVVAALVYGKLKRVGGQHGMDQCSQGG